LIKKFIHFIILFIFHSSICPLVIAYLVPGGKSKPIPPGTRLASVYFFHQARDMSNVVEYSERFPSECVL
jgi:hypothetical protein